MSFKETPSSEVVAMENRHMRCLGLKNLKTINTHNMSWKSSSGRRRPACTICGHTGHNRRNCSAKEEHDNLDGKYKEPEFKEYYIYSGEKRLIGLRRVYNDGTIEDDRWDTFRQMPKIKPPKREWITSRYPIWHPKNPKNT